MQRLLVLLFGFLVGFVSGGVDLVPRSNAGITSTYSIIKSVQSGSITVSGGTSNTATITAVNTAKSVVLFLGSNTASSQTTSLVRLTLTDSTTITGNCSCASVNGTANFMVLEFY